MMKVLALGPIFAALAAAAGAQTIAIPAPPSERGPSTPEAEAAHMQHARDLGWIH